MPSPFGPMTLGELVAALEATYRNELPEYFASLADKERCVYFDWCDVRPDGLGSYRGYYDHLAFGLQTDNTPPKVKDVLRWLRDADGETYTGYKGGEFRMSKETPIWVSESGQNSGWGICGVEDRGYTVHLKTQKFDHL